MSACHDIVITLVSERTPAVHAISIKGVKQPLILRNSNKVFEYLMYQI